MKNFVCAAVLAAAAPCVSTASTFVVNGQIVPAGGGNSTVDYWSFDVDTPGTVIIDTLSMNYFDYNMDPYIHLFTDDGVLGTDDLLASNDDSSDTFDDGSVHGYDSYLSENLAVGSYLLAIGIFYLDSNEAVVGTNDTTSFRCLAAVTGSCDHADYQITFTGVSSVAGGSVLPTTPVPLPPAAALLGGAVLGLGAFRRFSLG